MKPYHFYTGSHIPSWLAKTTIPLFVSHTRLARRRTFPQAICSWALDSGAFSEIAEHGHFITPPTEYVAAVRRYMTEIGNMRFAAIQDWMCEAPMLKRTGLTIQEHQRRTIESYLTLQNAAPEIPWMPTLQGYSRDDYNRHVDDYTDAGIDLREFERVGLGSVCRRQATMEIFRVVYSLASQGLRLHGFGVKLQGLALCKDYLVSADSMAWSFAARREPPMKGHTGHKNCANCKPYAELWYRLKVWPLINNRIGVSDDFSFTEQSTSAEAERLQQVVNLDSCIA